MKKIEAVFLPMHLREIQMELQRLGMRCGLTVCEVRQSDSQQDSEADEGRSHRRFRQLLKLELIVEDLDAEKAVNAILGRAQPDFGEEGGQITVLTVTVNEALRRGR
jgi:nitrogen regulatory protein PII